MTTLDAVTLKKRPLPDGWRWVTLGEAGTYWNGRAFRPEEWREEGTPIVRIENLNTPDAPFNYFQGDARPQHWIDNGDLLVSWSASLDAYIWDRGPALLNQHIFKVEENTSIVLRGFFFIALRHAMSRIRERVHGATMQHITKPEFERIELPLPPLPEQKRIAALLNEQLAAVERARIAVGARVEAAEALRASHLHSVFGGDEGRAWPTVLLGEIAEIVSGIQKSPERAPVQHHRPYLTVRNVQRGYLDLSQVERFEVTDGEIERLRLQEGDILIVEGNGSIDHIGRNALFVDNGDEWIHQNHIIRVRLPRHKCLYEFASLYLNSGQGREQMIKKAQTTSGLYTLSSGKVASLEVPLPPVDRQAEVVRFFDARLQSVRALKQAIHAEEDAIDAIPTALFRRAFSGGL